jgi:hypothetical protein
MSNEDYEKGYKSGRTDEAHLRGLTQEIAALKAERDKLAKEAATSTAAFIKQCGDLDKLRAALEWYAKELPMSSGDIAREVLAGKMPEELARCALEEEGIATLKEKIAELQAALRNRAG